MLFIVSCGGGGGGGGGGSDPTTPTTPAPTVTLSAEPTSVLLDNTSTLTWSSTNASSCSANWTSQTSISGSEAVTITSAGNNSFSISCTGDGGSRSASVTVEGYRNTDGIVVDGYISGAEVFIDEDDDWLLDSNENSTTSDNDGKFTIKYANGNLVSIGGTDLDSQTLLDNLLITHKLTGHSDFKAVTPVTSIAAFMEDASLVNSALGIDSSIDVFTFDPVANKGDGGINDYLYEKGNQLTVLAFALQNITNNLNTTTETTQDYFKAITEEIEKEYTETETKVNIETEAFVTKVFDNVITAKSVTIDEAAKSNTVTALAGMLPVIQVKSEDDLTTAVIRFAISTLQTDIQAIADGSASAETLKSYTEDLLNYIAEDQNIDSDKIAPNITAIADSVITQEDTAVEIDVLLNDSYVAGSPIILTIGNASNGITELVDKFVIYTPNSDFNGEDSFTYALVQGDKASSSNVAVTIEPVNDAPSIDIASTIQVKEGETAVTTVSVSDVDEDELTLTLSGVDSQFLSLSNDRVLTFNEAPDFETKSSYSISLSLSDGEISVSKDITIEIIDVNDAAPVFTSDDIFNVDENQTAIGTVTATDPEGDDFTFSINNSEINIDASSGVLTFVVAPDYETKSSYTALITAIDTEDNSSTQAITINILNLNDNSPVITSSNSFNADENQIAIGTATATDVDGDQISFSIDSSDINIDASSGILSFVSAPDYETKSTYTATVTASDGVNSATQSISISINDINETPTITSTSAFNADENQIAIGTATATDDDGDQISFSIDSSDINIDASSGILSFVSAPDYETKSTYTATVTASDGANSTIQDITVNVNNLNDNSPQFTSDLNFNADENQTAIGTVTATDADGDGIVYSISGSEININSVSGVLTFVSAPDYETKSTYTATVTASDGVNSETDNITVNINNLNDNEPIFTGNTVFNADENQTAIGAVSATDPDGGAITYSIAGSEILIDSLSGVLTFVAAPDYETKNTYEVNVIATDSGNSQASALITIAINNLNDNTPEITSSSSFSVDENNNNIGQLEATDADGDEIIYSVDNNVDQNIDITVAANNNGSGNVYVISGAQNKSLNFQTGKTYIFNHPSGHPLRFSTTADGTHGGGVEYTSGVDTSTNGITKITITEDTPSSLYYYCSIHSEMGSNISTGVNNNPILIQVNSSSGSLTFSRSPDFETLSFFSAKASASDGERITYQDIQVDINDIEPEGPVFTSSSTFVVDENETFIGQVTVSNSSNTIFSISGNEININESTGDLTFIEEADYEVKSSYTATVSASDGTNSTDQVITVNLNNLNDNRPIINEQTFNVDENQTSVGTVIASDADNDTLTYSTNSQYLNIDSTTGVLTFEEAPDYEGSFKSYSLFVKVSDGSYEENGSITININNLNDNSPSFTSGDSSFSVDENQNAIGQVSATDADGDTPIFSITGSEININSSTGVLEFVDSPDYETKNQYSETITASDGENSTELAITVSINNLDDNRPVFTSSSTFSAEENQSAIGTVQATDADGDTLSYSVTCGHNCDYEMDSSTGVFTFKRIPNYERKNTYTADIYASDSAGSTLQQVTISITDVNDVPPVITSSSTFSADENQTAIGTITASDCDGVMSWASDRDCEETGQTELTYSISGSEINIDATSGVMTFVSEPDYETKSSYSASVTVSDGTFSDTEDITVSINNINDNGPEITSSSTFNVDENETSIGTVTATDLDNDNLTYSISGSEININDSTGVLVFTSAPDYETKTSYSATVTVTDGDNSASQEITVSINDLNDNSPVITSSNSFNADENQTAIGTVTATDADAGSNLSFSVTGSNLSISSEGVLSFDSAPDYESTTSYTGTVSVSDGTNSISQNLTISVNDLNDEVPYIWDESRQSYPWSYSPQAYAIEETVNCNTNYGSRYDNYFEIRDADTPAANLSVTIANEDQANFAVSDATKVITGDDERLRFYFTCTASGLDRESQGATIDFDINFSDGLNSNSATIVVGIDDTNDSTPVITSSDTMSINENEFNVGYLTISDADQDTWCSIERDNCFNSSWTITVSGTDAYKSNGVTPNFGSCYYSVSSGGERRCMLQTYLDEGFNYEDKQTYEITLTIADAFETNSSTKDITVNVIDVPEAPTITSGSTYSVTENESYIGTVSATDPEGDSITWSISGSEITVDSSTQTLRFVSAPDYETKSTYTATLTASDGTLSTTKDITINILNIPDVTGLAYTSRYSVMDSDIPNTDYLPYASNDTVSEAQALINPSSVTGFVGGSDTIDVFSVSTTSSMYVNLDVVDYVNDTKELRVLIYESDGTSKDFSYTSGSVENNMTILLPSSGDYLIAVDDLYGSSKYILTLGQRYETSSLEKATDFIPDYIQDEFVGYKSEILPSITENNELSTEQIDQININKEILFNLTGTRFDEPGVKKIIKSNVNTEMLSLFDSGGLNLSLSQSGLDPLPSRQLKYLEDWSFLQTIKSLDKDVIFDFNYEFELASFSRDPLFAYQWNLQRVNLEAALNGIGQTVNDIAVAVIDTGGPTPGSTAWNESNLIDGGFDFMYGDSNSIDYYATSDYTGNDSSHGTHVSTTIAAKNNGTGINGYAVKALNINVFDQNPNKSRRTDSTKVINAILYSAGLSNTSGSVAPTSTPIKVINLSLKSSGSSAYLSSLCASVTDAVSQGITVVAASGNDQDTDPGSISYPASCSGAISVGASNSNGEITTYSQQNAYVDIAAPGGDVIDRDGNGYADLVPAYVDNDRIVGLPGTSMASPQVSAAIALMYAVDNSMSPSKVITMLEAGELSDDRGTSGRDDAFGYGELNVAKAIENVLEDISSSTTYAYTSLPYLDFGSNSTQLTIDLNKVGDGSLSVSNLTADSATGLSYNNSGVDSNGFGTYTIFIDRSSIPNGEFSNTIYFNLSDGEKVAVRIYYNVGTLRSRANIGKVYIGMYDADTGELWGSLESEVDGYIAFIARDVPLGNYYILTSTDIDDDNTVCDYAELCEYYPPLNNTEEYFSVGNPSGDENNLGDYEIFLTPRVKYGGINAASVSSSSNDDNVKNKNKRIKSFDGNGEIIVNDLVDSPKKIEFIKGDKNFGDE